MTVGVNVAVTGSISTSEIVGVVHVGHIVGPYNSHWGPFHQNVFPMRSCDLHPREGMSA